MFIHFRMVKPSEPPHVRCSFGHNSIQLHSSQLRPAAVAPDEPLLILKHFPHLNGPCLAPEPQAALKELLAEEEFLSKGEGRN